MRISVNDIAKALVDSLEKDPHIDLLEACEGALTMLRTHNPGVPPRVLLAKVEREMRHRGHTSTGLIVVPHEKAMPSKHLEELLSKTTGKQVTLERATDPSLIGGAVLLVDHMRVDYSVKAALQTLLNICLQPLD